MVFLYRSIFNMLLLFVCSDVASAYAQADEVFSSCAHKTCLAIIDAGSTGTRLHLFSYQFDFLNHTQSIQEIYTHAEKPGLADVDLTSIEAYLSTIVPTTEVQSAFPIPIYVYATAGMRLRNEDDQKKYYQTIQSWFGHHPEWNLLEARTITGHEEGLFGWLALNHYLNRLEHANKPLVNLIEIGGASAQIAFPVRNNEVSNSSDVEELMIQGQPVAVFAHGFLGLGVNEIFRSTQDEPACYPISYLLESGRVGDGNADVCQAHVGDRLQQDYHVTELSERMLEQNAGEAWYTVGAIASMSSRKPFIFLDDSLTAQELINQTDQALCQQTYSELQSHYPNDPYIHKNCLLGAYFYSLLVHGYQFSPQLPIHYLSKYNGDWTVGVLLYQFMKVTHPST